MADQNLQSAAKQALLQVPAVLKRGIDPSKITVKEVDAKGGLGYHNQPIAGFDKDNPNQINVYNKAKFLADPSATLTHEMTHRLLNQAGPGFMQTLQPINKDNPYEYDQNSVGKLPLNKLSEEQIAQQMGDFQSGLSDPSKSADYKQQIKQQIQPLYDQLTQVPTAPTIQTAQPSANDQMNTNPAPPTSVFEAQAPQAPPDPGGSIDTSGFEEVPEDTSSFEEVPEQSIQQQNQGALRQGLIGAAKGVGDALVGSSPLGTMVGMIPAVQKTLSSSNPDQSAGKVAAAGVGALEGAGPETLDSLISGVKNLTSNLTDKGATAAMHGSLNQTAQKVADELGVKLNDTGSIRDPMRQIAEGVRAKGQSLMDEITHTFSGLTGSTGDVEQQGMIGDYDQIGKDIQKQQAKVQSLIGPQNMEKRAAAVKQLDQLQANQKLADNMLEQRGLTGARSEADRLFKQADDLDAVSKSINKNVNGPTPKMQQAGVKGEERLNGQKLAPELEKHYINGTLQNAVGEDHAHTILNQVQTGARLQGRNQAIQDLAKGAAKRAGAYAIGDALAHGIEKVL